MKARSSGPVGIALFVFDMLSLAIDIWDPSGYHDVQSAGPIKDLSDLIVQQYTDILKSEGTNSPLAADPLYRVDPEKQMEMVENSIIEWFSEQIAVGWYVVCSAAACN